MYNLLCCTDVKAALSQQGGHSVVRKTINVKGSTIYIYIYIYIYEVQQDTQSVLMSEFIHHLC